MIIHDQPGEVIGCFGSKRTARLDIQIQLARAQHLESRKCPAQWRIAHGDLEGKCFSTCFGGKARLMAIDVFFFREDKRLCRQGEFGR